MYRVQGGESLNDISQTRNSLNLSLISDLLRRCLKEQIKDIKSESFLLKPEHNEVKTLHLEKNKRDVLLKLWLRDLLKRKVLAPVLRMAVHIFHPQAVSFIHEISIKQKDQMTFQVFFLFHTKGVCGWFTASDILRDILEM